MAFSNLPMQTNGCPSLLVIRQVLSKIWNLKTEPLISPSILIRSFPNFQLHSSSAGLPACQIFPLNTLPISHTKIGNLVQNYPKFTFLNFCGQNGFSQISEQKCKMGLYAPSVETLTLISTFNDSHQITPMRDRAIRCVRS